MDSAKQHRLCKSEMVDILQPEIQDRIKAHLDLIQNRRYDMERNIKEIHQETKHKKREMRWPLPKERRNDFVNFYKTLYEGCDVQEYKKIKKCRTWQRNMQIF